MSREAKRSGARGYGLETSCFDGSGRVGATTVGEAPDSQRGCPGC
ncbi:MAG: hypothetical protein ACFFBZ_07120 [Promethearchaeota archaeon]